jgi:AraC family transcriptional regulator, alkane utilization regulator
MTVSAVTERIGYESEAAFSKAFKRHFGVPTRAYRGRAAQVAPRAQPGRWSQAASGRAGMRAPA